MLDKCVYLVNSTPKYYSLLPLHFALLERYWPECPMDLALATEVPDHPVCQQLVRDHGVTLIPLKGEEAGFLDSRAAALRCLQAAGRWSFVLPVQEDFLLEGRPMREMIESACFALCAPDVDSVRLMPCPGPGGPDVAGKGDEERPWWPLAAERDAYGFTFQATLWRLDACAEWYWLLTRRLEAEWPRATTPAAKRLEVEVRGNFAENGDGQKMFWAWAGGAGGRGPMRHLAWVREGPWSNAVYRCPWPYRPTAVVRGKLEPWARELAEREGFGADVRGLA